MRPAGASSGLDLIVLPERVEASLWRRLRLEAEADCREQLFDRYVGFARTIAKRHHRRRAALRIEGAEFEQLAYEGLLQAIDRFDPLQRVPFSAYARRRISGSIADGIARMSEAGAQTRYRYRIEQERMRSLAPGGNPAEDAVAALSDLAVGLALGLILEGTIAVSENAPDPAPNAYESLEWRDMQLRLGREVTKLPEREAIIIRQHYDNGLSFAQIAVLLGLSRGRVSQLHRAALERLRKKMGALA